MQKTKMIVTVYFQSRVNDEGFTQTYWRVYYPQGALNVTERFENIASCAEYLNKNNFVLKNRHDLIRQANEQGEFLPEFTHVGFRFEIDLKTGANIRAEFPTFEDGMQVMAKIAPNEIASMRADVLQY